MRFILPNPEWCINTEPRWKEWQGASHGHTCYVRHRHQIDGRYSELTWGCQYKEGIPYNCNSCGALVPEEVLGFRNLAEWSLEGEPYEEDRHTRP